MNIAFRFRELRKYRMWLIAIFVLLASISTLQLLFLRGQVVTQAVTLRLMPTATSVTSGSLLEVDIFIDARPNAAIAAVEITVLHPTSFVFINTDIEESEFPYEIKPFTASGAGTKVSGSLVRFDTGFVGISGLVGRLHFRAVKAGNNMPITFDAVKTIAIAYEDAASIPASQVGTDITVTHGGIVSSSSSSSQSSSSSVSSSQSSVPASSQPSSSDAAVAPLPPPPPPATGGNGGGGGGRGRSRSAGRNHPSEPSAPYVPSGSQTSSLRPAAPAVACQAKRPAYTDKNILLTKTVDNVLVVFTDVPSATWFAKYVSFLVDNEIVKGYTDAAGKPTGRFGASDDVKHAEVIKMIIEASDPSYVVKALRSDEQWFDPYLNEALRKKWTLPTTSVINPIGSASRGAVAKYIQDGFKFTKGTNTVYFSDLPATHRFAADITILASHLIFQGDDGKQSVRPDAPINRAEVSAMLVRAMDRSCDE